MAAPLDVFIPYHAKDRHTLPLAVAAARRWLVPQPARVRCIGAGLAEDDARAVTAAGGELLDEAHAPDLPPLAALPAIVVQGRRRTGWYYQQLLKWACRRLAGGPAYVVLDADTVLVAPLALMQDGRHVLDRTAQHHEPYFAAIDRLLGWRPAPDRSFIANYQIIDVALLDGLLAAITAHGGGQPWHERILAAVDRSQLSGFSEFETYGAWLARHHPDAFTSRTAANHGTRRRQLPYHPLLAPWAVLHGHTSISYHEYTGR